MRTVRKQLDLARKERETRETRLIVLRDAAQAHYADLCKRAAEIESALNGRSFGVVSTADRMCVALRQHLPRAPLWKYLDRWNDLQEALQRLSSDIKIKLEDEIRNDSKLRSTFSGGNMNVESLAEVMAHQLDMWSRGSSGLNVVSNFKMEPSEGGQINFRYGAWSIDMRTAEQSASVKDAIAEFEKKISELEEYHKLREMLSRVGPLKKDVQEEVAIITMRRVVPGKCKYCPV